MPEKEMPAASKKSRRKARPKRRKTFENDGRDFPIVGVGASAGGLESFKSLLQGMPADTGIAFVLIQHLDPDHESLMADLLSKYTTMPVLQVENATAIQPNHVYMIPPNKYIKIQDGGLFLDEPVKQRGMRMAIDYFFRSLAESRKDAGICIVLSGTGSDGTLGLKEIKALGGMAMVQKPGTAEYDGMPRSAIATGLVDFVLPIEEMPDVLVKYVRHPYVDGTAAGASLEESAPDHFRSIVNLLRAHTDYDFRSYKKGTLNRRIHRRMGLRHIQNVADYLKLLRADPDEVRLLFKDLLIGVTRFFRDKEAWVTLEEVAVATIVKEHALHDPLRVWVPGCSTGEEALSLGMLFFDELERQQKAVELQLFATDLDEDAIQRGRIGLYPASIAGDVGTKRLKRYFTEDGDTYRVSKRLRESVIFAVQNLITDPPFSGLDLICCRNVLIYLETDFQKRLFDLFHFALKKDGFLFLGNAEAVNDPKRFEPISKNWRIYRKRGQTKRGAVTFPVAPDAKRPALLENEHEEEPLTAFRTIETAKQALLDTYAPASVVIDRDHEIRYYQGRLRDFLDLPHGEPTQNVLAIAAEGLRSKLRGIVQRALHEKKRVDVLAPRVKLNGKFSPVRIVAEPLPRPKSGTPMFLVSFILERGTSAGVNRPAAKKPERAARKDEADPEDTLVEQLQYELDATRQDLQSTIEELETSNEELKASNEEVMSMNEELQSTNEELETSREELQSLNEELSTVNNELEDKVGELEFTNNDLRNLLSSTEIATIFLDTSLRIRRYTPATTELLNAIETDVGRPISDLAPRVNDQTLLEDARTVMKKLSPREREVHNDDGRWFLRRILPYRTSEDRIDGVVITFTDITTLKATARRLEARERQQAVIASLGRAALGEKSLQELFDFAVEKIRDTLDVDYCKLLELTPEANEFRLRAGVGWQRGLVGAATVPAGMDSQAGYTLQSRGPVIVEDVTRERRFSDSRLLKDHDVVSGVSVIVGKSEEPWGVLGVHSKQRVKFSVDDVNFLEGVAHLLWEAISRRRIERDLDRSRRRLQSIADTVPVLIAFVNRDEVFEFNNAQYEEWFDVPREELRGRHMRDVLGEKIYEEVKPNIDRALAGEPVTFERVHHPSDSERRSALVSYAPSRDAAGDVVGFTVSIADVTEIKNTEESLLLSQEAGGVGTWDWNVERGRAVCSEEFFRIYGLEPTDGFTYTDWLSRVHPEDREGVERQMTAALSGNQEYEMEFRIVRPDGEERWVSGKGRVFFDESGDAHRMLGVNTDITRRKKLELGLVRAQEELKQASQLKDEFLALLGHELRNPLGAIANGVQLLRSEGSTEHRGWAEEMLERQVKHLSRLVDDLLDLSRITKGQIEIRKSHVELKSIIAGAVDSLRDLVDARGHQLVLSLPEERVHLWADPARIEQVVNNLLTNAIKYTETSNTDRGRIELEVTTTAQEAVIRVRDNGVGIPPGALDVIFEPFVRVSEKLDRAGSGLGIGLTLVKRLVELHDGSIQAHSTGPEQGAEFTVTFPLATDVGDGVAETSSASATDGPSAALRVLIIDDNRDLAEGLRKRLHDMGHTVTVAYDGMDGVERAREFRPRVVLVDVGLPGLDGYQVAKALRSNLSGPLWVAAISGYKQDGEEEAALKLFDRYFIKPVDFDELHHTLSAITV